MKAIKILGHPISVMVLFSMLLISGENLGGFYLMYLLMALPHAAIYAMLGFAGLISMFAGYMIGTIINILKPVFYVSAEVLMVSSLFLFFKNSRGYNDATFHQTVPLICFVLFGFCILSNLLIAISYMFKRNIKKTMEMVA